jgi:hypothetical protein
MVSCSDQVNTAGMNAYFTPKTPDPAPRGLAIVLGSMMCALVVVLSSVGLWLAHDTFNKKAVPEPPTRAEWSSPSNTTVAAWQPNPPD